MTCRALVASWLVPFACVVVVGCGAAPTAGPEVPPVDPALRERALALEARALEDNRAIATLRSLVAAAPRRLAGSPGMLDAERWAVETMREIGFDEVRLEPVLVPAWQRGVEAAATTAPTARPLRVTALGGSIGTPIGGIEAEVVEVRSFEQLRELGAAAEGRIVFFNRPMPRVFRRTGRAYGSAVPQRSNGAIEAAKVGAVAAIVRSMTTTIDGYPHTGAMHYDDAVPKVPAAAVATEDAEALSAMLATGPVRVSLELGCRTLDDVEGHNVIGELRGTTRPDELVLIGAHLDAWDLGTGAHDDGAGCVHCVEAVRLLRAIGWRPKRTIRVVLFANEENGLHGARAYAAAHAAEVDRHVAAIESDSGGFTPQGFSCSLRGDEAAAVERLFAPLDQLGAGLFLPGAGAGGADISVLHAQGVPCFGMWVDGHRYFDYHHTAVDDLPAVNERELALGAAVLAYAAAALADR
ncbi:MAG: M20/M25/M40 family metallo-hydrolase [Planctomycetes bacterium]|nr:M20/M25/M40 family metallo-hydrolase [Planctomycetota bacterium]